MDLLALAKTAADRIETEAAKLKVPVAVCVIDIHGNIVLTHRMGGAPVFAALVLPVVGSVMTFLLHPSGGH